jgi:proteic killer suppression protein
MCRHRDLFEQSRIKRFVNIESVARRKLNQRATALVLRDLAAPPGKQAGALERESLLGQHRIHINDQWRICFTWTDDAPEAVEIVDYH